MRVADLPIDPRVRDVLVAQGLEELYPVQAEALAISLTGTSLLLAAPTASGKSLVAFATIFATLERGRKAIYIVPLRALASEKHRELQELAPPGIRVGLAIGDYDETPARLADLDILVTTSEKADSLLRHGHELFQRIGLVVADEIHLIQDPGRGPTLEILLTKLRLRDADLQVLALSATVANADEVAAWLEAELVESDWRPIELRRGVAEPGRIVWEDRSVDSIHESGAGPVVDLVRSTVERGGSVLVFCNSRKGTEAEAERIAAALPRIQHQVMWPEGDRDTVSLELRLRTLMPKGVAFHHAGLTTRLRNFVEDQFKRGNLKVLTATPTLAAGVNLPARRVIIRDVFRFAKGIGMVPIPNLEVNQMAGRAGRPQFDPHGEALVLAKDPDQAAELASRYWDTGPEPIESKLGVATALRGHVLGAIRDGSTLDPEALLGLFGAALVGHQYGTERLQPLLQQTIVELQEAEMVDGEPAGPWSATPFGALVSDLYLDPISGWRLRTILERGEVWDELAYLHGLAWTLEVMGLSVRRRDDWLYELAEVDPGRWWIPTPQDEPEEEDWFEALKVGCLIQDWLAEMPEEYLLDRYGIGPGDLRTRVEAIKWVHHGAERIDGLFGPQYAGSLRDLTLCLDHGVKAELLDLVRIHGIGRVRARTLFQAGYRDRSAIKAATLPALATLRGFGPDLAVRLLREVGVKLPEVPPGPGTGQARLFEFDESGTRG